MTSTTRSEFARISSKSPRERVRTPASSGRSPVMGTIASARSRSSVAKAEPTVPWPSRPTLNVSGTQVLVGLAADDDPRAPVAAEQHGRAADAVVVGRHGVAVGAGRGGDEHVAGPRVGQARAAHEHVA